MAKRLKILILDDDAEMLTESVNEFERQGFEALGAANLAETEQRLAKHNFEAVFFNISDTSPAAFDVIEKVRKHKSLASAISFMMADTPYAEGVTKLVGKKSLKIISKPITMGDIVRVIKLTMANFAKSVDYKQGVFQAVGDSITEVIEFYVQDQMNRKDPCEKKNTKVQSFISSIMSLSGSNCFGTILLNLDKGLISKIAGAMMGADDMEFDDETLVDIAGEICNQLTGVLTHKFEQMGYHAEIGLPKPFLCGKTQFEHPGRNQVGIIEFKFATEGKGKRFSLFGGDEDISSVEICFDKIA